MSFQRGRNSHEGTGPSYNNVSKTQQILFVSKVKVLHVFIFNKVQETGLAGGKLYNNTTQKDFKGRVLTISKANYFIAKKIENTEKESFKVSLFLIILLTFMWIRSSFCAVKDLVDISYRPDRCMPVPNDALTQACCRHCFCSIVTECKSKYIINTDTSMYIKRYM